MLMRPSAMMMVMWPQSPRVQHRICCGLQEKGGEAHKEEGKLELHFVMELQMSNGSLTEKLKREQSNGT